MKACADDVHAFLFSMSLLDAIPFIAGHGPTIPYFKKILKYGFIPCHSVFFLYSGKFPFSILGSDFETGGKLLW